LANVAARLVSIFSISQLMVAGEQVKVNYEQMVTQKKEKEEEVHWQQVNKLSVIHGASKLLQHEVVKKIKSISSALKKNVLTQNVSLQNSLSIW